MRGLICLLILLAPTPAWAIDVTFTGIVLNTCTLAVPTPGIMTLSGDGKTLGSDQTLGVPAELTIVSLGANTITLAPPTLETYPAGYASGSETVQMSYNGVSGLSGVSHAYTSAQQTFSVGILPITSLFINNQVVNTAGFVQGTYTTKTVVTCS